MGRCCACSRRTCAGGRMARVRQLDSSAQRSVEGSAPPWSLQGAERAQAQIAARAATCCVALYTGPRGRAHPRRSPQHVALARICLTLRWRRAHAVRSSGGRPYLNRRAVHERRHEDAGHADARHHCVALPLLGVRVPAAERRPHVRMLVVHAHGGARRAHGATSPQPNPKSPRRPARTRSGEQRVRRAARDSRARPPSTLGERPVEGEAGRAGSPALAPGALWHRRGALPAPPAPPSRPRPAPLSQQLTGENPPIFLCRTSYRFDSDLHFSTTERARSQCAWDAWSSIGLCGARATEMSWRGFQFPGNSLGQPHAGGLARACALCGRCRRLRERENGGSARPEAAIRRAPRAAPRAAPRPRCRRSRRASTPRTRGSARSAPSSRPAARGTYRYEARAPAPRSRTIFPFHPSPSRRAGACGPPARTASRSVPPDASSRADARVRGNARTRMHSYMHTHWCACTVTHLSLRRVAT